MTENLSPAAPAPAALTPRELFRQQNAEANERLNALASSVTQREWLLITQALDRTRAQIGSDTGLTLLAMAWVKEKRAHGGASWDRLLDYTDTQLEDLHGYPSGSEDDYADTLTPAGPDDAELRGDEPAEPIE